MDGKFNASVLAYAHLKCFFFFKKNKNLISALYLYVLIFFVVRLGCWEFIWQFGAGSGQVV
jgi:hypothetical protein